ncbi:MAG TPA: hypothetical protein VNS22_27655 [Geminicoccus sp.]|uniref:hypothetical protein n=1 Tax=Geminicoccus sp. TaxID=2024832 RepID=UPI002C41EFC1|nr:hypothetical protein [Geminicoccus sp.]HWL72136.1 hypothetical protein [Geminicoccus sp.]
MRVLAIDPGVSLGWAVVAPNEIPQFGEISLKGRLDPKYLHVTDRHAAYFDRCTGAVVHLIEEHCPECLLVEEMAGRMLGEAARILPGLRAQVLCVGRRRELLTIEVNNASWAKWARRHGYVKADDGSDARWMAEYWLEHELRNVREAA